jgi:hypothetical protein
MAGSRLVGMLVAGAMMFTSTAAFASAGPAPAKASPWVVLAGMSGGAPASALCGSAAVAAAAAAQGAAPGCVLPVVDQPVAGVATQPSLMAVPPVETAGPGVGLSPMLIGLAALALGTVLYFVLRNNGDDDGDTVISPA